MFETKRLILYPCTKPKVHQCIPLHYRLPQSSNMGGNRRHRGSQSSSNQNHRRSSSDSSFHHNLKSAQNVLGSNNSTIPHNDALLAEIEGGLSISWRDIGRCGLTMLILSMLGIVLGVAAGMTISIHYFEKSVVTGDAAAAAAAASSSPSSISQGGRRGLSNSHTWRVTMFDPIILGSNTLTKKKNENTNHHLDLGTVLTATASGQLDVLFVVDEATPLTEESSPQPVNVDGMSEDVYNENSQKPDAKSSSRRMTLEEANILVPQYTEWLESQPNIYIREPTIHPITCSDGSLGFDDWTMLKAAVQEANSISAERFMKWSSYFANVGKQFVAFLDDQLYYEEDIIFQICPGAQLKARRGPIFLNAVNVVIECADDCSVDVGGTHLAFGPHARNVLVTGITFRGARSSSVTFFHDGAEATFEDCRWIGNTGISGKFGAVADINSTAVVNFHRCEIGDGKATGWFGGTQPPGGASSLSIRT